MNSEWFKDAVGDAARQERKELVKGAKPTLDVLKNILQKREAVAVMEMTAMKTYDTGAAWPYQQADYISQIRCLRELIQLLTIEDSK